MKLKLVLPDVRGPTYAYEDLLSPVLGRAYLELRSIRVHVQFGGIDALVRREEGP